jgi:hypothetical protein
MDYPALLSYMKIPKSISKKTKDERTPIDAVIQSLDTIPDSEWANPSKYWADFACGRGTIALQIVHKLRTYGHTDDHIAKHLYVLDINSDFVNYTTKSILESELKTKNQLNLICADFLRWSPPKNMKFNVIFNPSWNVTLNQTGNGTGGDVGYWKKHYNRAKEFLDEYMIIFCMKTIIDHLTKDTTIDPMALHLMTDKNYWDANACWVTLKNQIKSNFVSTNIIQDKNAIGKIILCDRINSNWRELNGRVTKSKIKSNGIKAIIKLPNKKTPEPTYARVDPSYKKLILGPKFATTLLTNERSHIVTSEPMSADHMAVYTTTTLEEAKKIELFVNNSDLLLSISKKMRIKGLAQTLKYVKEFDPNQIITGHEIPMEWNLTQNEINDLLDMSYGIWKTAD